MALSNLTTRILVAIVGIPAILAVTLAGGYLFFAFVALVGHLALHEFYALARAKGASPQVIPGMFFGLLFVAVFMYDRLHVAVPARVCGVGSGDPAPDDGADRADPSPGVCPGGAAHRAFPQQALGGAQYGLDRSSAFCMSPCSSVLSWVCANFLFRRIFPSGRISRLSVRPFRTRSPR